MDDKQLFAGLKQHLVDRGASIVACADLRLLPGDVRNGLPLGVSIGVALAPSVIARIVNGPTSEYATEYERANALLAGLGQDCAGFLQGRGFRAEAKKPTVDKIPTETLATPLPHKTSATLGGVGWIGKSGLLVSPEYGSAVRYNTVLTDAELEPGTPIEVSQCGDCTNCVDACPARALANGLWEQGMPREVLVDAFVCFEATRQRSLNLGCSHILCGICIARCPHTQEYLARHGIEVE